MGKGLLRDGAKLARLIQYAQDLKIVLPERVVKQATPKVTVKLLGREKRRLLEMLSQDGKAVVTANPQGTVRVHSWDGYQSLVRNGKRAGKMRWVSTVGTDTEPVGTVSSQ